MLYFKSLPPVSDEIIGREEVDRGTLKYSGPVLLFVPAVGRMMTSLAGMVSEPPTRVKLLFDTSTDTMNPPVLKTVR